MRYGSNVRIISDRSWERYGVARNIEVISQAFSMNTTLLRATTEEELVAQGHSPSDGFALTILSCHGYPQKDGPTVMTWSVGRRLNAIEWEDVELRLAPEDIGRYFGSGSGTLLNTACWSGSDGFAEAFIGAGYDHYVAPARTSDCFSFYQFLAAFLGYLVYEQRDTNAQALSVAECVEKARAIDDLRDGANGFRCFPRERWRRLG